MWMVTLLNGTNASENSFLLMRASQLSEPLGLCCFLFLLLAKVSPGVGLQLLNVLTMEGWIDVFIQVSLVSGFI